VGELPVPLPLGQIRVKWFTALMAKSASRQASGPLPLTGIRMWPMVDRGGRLRGVAVVCRRGRGLFGGGLPVSRLMWKIKVVRPITRKPRNPHQNYGCLLLSTNLAAECANSCLAHKITFEYTQISVSIYLSTHIHRWGGQVLWDLPVQRLLSPICSGRPTDICICMYIFVVSLGH